jgi:hypothetical protein
MSKRVSLVSARIINDICPWRQPKVVSKCIFLIWPTGQTRGTVAVDLGIGPSVCRFIRPTDKYTWKMLQGMENEVVLDPHGVASPELVSFVASCRCRLISGMADCKIWIEYEYQDG